MDGRSLQDALPLYGRDAKKLMFELRVRRGVA